MRSSENISRRVSVLIGENHFQPLSDQTRHNFYRSSASTDHIQTVTGYCLRYLPWLIRPGGLKLGAAQHPEDTPHYPQWSVSVEGDHHLWIAVGQSARKSYKQTIVISRRTDSLCSAGYTLWRLLFCDYTADTWPIWATLIVSVFTSTPHDNQRAPEVMRAARRAAGWRWWVSGGSCGWLIGDNDD